MVIHRRNGKNANHKDPHPQHSELLARLGSASSMRAQSKLLTGYTSSIGKGDGITWTLVSRSFLCSHFCWSIHAELWFGYEDRGRINRWSCWIGSLRRLDHHNEEGKTQRNRRNNGPRVTEQHAYFSLIYVVWWSPRCCEGQICIAFPEADMSTPQQLWVLPDYR